MTATTLLTRTLTALTVVLAALAGNRVVAADPPVRPVTPFVDADYAPPPASTRDEFLEFYRKRFAPKPVVVFDRSRFPDERDEFAAMELACALGGEPVPFPFLGEDYEVLGPSTGTTEKPRRGARPYNCIAWTIGVTDRWVWPGYAVADFDRLYARYGFKPIEGLDYSVRAGVEKVLIYEALNEKGVRVVTHGAKQEGDGTWTSKLGGMALIKHRTPEAVSGGTYGSPKRVYVRTARATGGQALYALPPLNR